MRPRHTRARMFDGRPDPAPDVWSVARPAEGVFLVKHYLSAAETIACCEQTIVKQPGESDIDALRRAPECVRQAAPVARDLLEIANA